MLLFILFTIREILTPRVHFPDRGGPEVVLFPDRAVMAAS